MVNEEKHTDYKVDLLLKNYPELDNSFKPVVEQWLHDRTIPDMKFDGLTIRDVMEKTTNSLPRSS